MQDGYCVELLVQWMCDDVLWFYCVNFVGDGCLFLLCCYDIDCKIYVLFYENIQISGIWDFCVVLGWFEVDIGVVQLFDFGFGISRGLNKIFFVRIENCFYLNVIDSVMVGVDYYDCESCYSDVLLLGDVIEDVQNIGIYVQVCFELSDWLVLFFGVCWDYQDFIGMIGWDDSFFGFSGNVLVFYVVIDSLKLCGGMFLVFGGVMLEDNFIFNLVWDYIGLKVVCLQNYMLGFDYEVGDLWLDGELFLIKINDVWFSLYCVNDNVDVESCGFNFGFGYGWVDGFLCVSYLYSKIKVNGVGIDSYSVVDLGVFLGGVFVIEVQQIVNVFIFGGSIQVVQVYDDIDVDVDCGILGYVVLNLFIEYILL